MMTRKTSSSGGGSRSVVRRRSSYPSIKSQVAIQDKRKYPGGVSRSVVRLSSRSPSNKSQGVIPGRNRSSPGLRHLTSASILLLLLWGVEGRIDEWKEDQYVTIYPADPGADLIVGDNEKPIIGKIRSDVHEHEEEAKECEKWWHCNTEECKQTPRSKRVYLNVEYGDKDPPENFEVCPSSNRIKKCDSIAPQPKRDTVKKKQEPFRYEEGDQDAVFLKPRANRIQTYYEFCNFQPYCELGKDYCDFLSRYAAHHKFDRIFNLSFRDRQKLKCNSYYNLNEDPLTPHKTVKEDGRTYKRCKTPVRSYKLPSGKNQWGCDACIQKFEDILSEFEKQITCERCKRKRLCERVRPLKKVWEDQKPFLFKKICETQQKFMRKDEMRRYNTQNLLLPGKLVCWTCLTSIKKTIERKYARLIRKQENHRLVLKVLKKMLDENKEITWLEYNNTAGPMNNLGIQKGLRKLYPLFHNEKEFYEHPVISNTIRTVAKATKIKQFAASRNPTRIIGGRRRRRGPRKQNRQSQPISKARKRRKQRTKAKA